MSKMNSRHQGRITRKVRIRGKVRGSENRARLTVFRSARHIYAQVVDDMDGKTLASASSLKLSGKLTGGNKEGAAEVGKSLAEAAKKAGVQSVVFDRNGYQYHGRVKALADAAREGGLSF